MTCVRACSFRDASKFSARDVSKSGLIFKSSLILMTTFVWYHWIYFFLLLNKSFVFLPFFKERITPTTITPTTTAHTFSSFFLFFFVSSCFSFPFSDSFFLFLYSIEIFKRFSFVEHYAKSVTWREVTWLEKSFFNPSFDTKKEEICWTTFLGGFHRVSWKVIILTWRI